MSKQSSRQRYAKATAFAASLVEAERKEKLLKIEDPRLRALAAFEEHREDEYEVREKEARELLATIFPDIAGDIEFEKAYYSPLAAARWTASPSFEIGGIWFYYAPPFTTDGGQPVKASFVPFEMGDDGRARFGAGCRTIEDFGREFAWSSIAADDEELADEE